MNYYGHGSRVNEYRLGIDSLKEVREHKEFLRQMELEKIQKEKELKIQKEIQLEKEKFKNLQNLEYELFELIGGGL